VDKVPPKHAFLDLSDYARPAARLLVRALLPTPVTPIHLTLAFTLVGVLAALLFALDRWLPMAGLLLLLKSALDAADGSLARARRRPSRVGRFLDSVCDFAVMAAVFSGIAISAWTRTRHAAYFGWATAGLLCATLQGSVFSYYYVRYRAQVSGDQTSRTSESTPDGYLWDDPVILRRLHRLYRLIYGWQDALMEHLDRRVAPGHLPVSRGFLTATTALGLGTQLLVIAACATLGQPAWSLWLFPTVFNLYWLLLLLLRRRTWLQMHAPHDTSAL
jgi:phosphatidylglycerophosphate synthase